MAKYNLANNDIAINSQQNLTTTYKTLAQVHATTGATTLRRGWVYDIMVGIDGTPADNVINWIVNRNSTAGTGTAHTPTPLETGDAACLLTGTVNFTIEPTITDQTGLLQIAVNQRASYRWVAAPGGEFVIPATNVAGIGVRAKSPAYASTGTASMAFWGVNVHRFSGTVEEIATIDTVKLMVVVGWITAIPFEEWGQQKPHGVLPLKPAMMSNRTWFNMGEATDPLVHDVLSGHYPGCIAQQAMLGVVMPGDAIPPHVDHQCPEWVERIHIPLTTNAACSFVCGGVEHYMAVGKAYRVNTEQVHAVYNRGSVPRVHFMFDVRT